MNNFKEDSVYTDVIPDFKYKKYDDYLRSDILYEVKNVLLKLDQKQYLECSDKLRTNTLCAEYNDGMHMVPLEKDSGGELVVFGVAKCLEIYNKQLYISPKSSKGTASKQSVSTHFQSQN